MKNLYKIINYLIISLTVLSMTSCSKAANVIKNDNETLANTTQKMYPENKTITSLSPDGKYRAEAYGTITQITAGGLFPYEGIRILRVDDGDVIWSMEPGGYTVSFSWSPDSLYSGVYYEGRIWGESIVIDLKKKKLISLPKLDEIASHYGESVKPQENRPDPYFGISGWENAETVIVDFRWTKIDGEEFSGQYTFNIKTNTIVYK